MHILMIAAENDALPGGKVGGIGDVIRDVPRALAAQGHTVTVLTPGYQHFSQLPGAECIGKVEALFAGAFETLQWYSVPGKAPVDGVEHQVLEHPAFAAGGAGQIYFHDAGDRPFATDASKFALFCAAAGQLLQQGQLAMPDVLHLHDWHAAPLAILRQFDPSFSALKAVRCVYTIHNLSLQGIRPLRGDESSLYGWYAGLDCDEACIVDPRYSDCVNLMRAGINLADRVHAVSPSYALEIQRSSNPDTGFIGGEGLERDLQQCAGDGRLFGILNGAEYPALPGRPGRSELFAQCRKVLEQWVAGNRGNIAAHQVALDNLAGWINDPAPQAPLLTSVGRLTAQKMALLAQPSGQGQVLDTLLAQLPTGGRLLVLGSGAAEFETQLVEAAAHHANLVFLNAYAESLADWLYLAGDLFLMPSSFEPCGISQMLAMRAGQPCLVHGVGGLRDTVIDGETGFVFNGDTAAEQADDMLARLGAALSIWSGMPEQWDAICKNAAAQRFLWQDTVRNYQRQLYQ